MSVSKSINVSSSVSASMSMKVSAWNGGERFYRSRKICNPGDDYMRRDVSLRSFFTIARLVLVQVGLNGVAW